MEKKKILFVDDDAEDRDFMFDAMRDVGADELIFFAEDGEHALKLLADENTEGRQPDLIVMDMNMPKLNGTETIALIRQNPAFANIPVVILSTSMNPLEHERTQDLGVLEYMIKPLGVKEGNDIARSLVSWVGRTDRTAITVHQSA